MSRRYVAVLAGIAATVLVAGLLTRRLLEPSEAPSTAPPSQATALQQLSMAGQLRRTATFVAERIAAVAPMVAFVPSLGATGIQWSGDSLLTTDPISVVRVIVDSAAADSLRRVATVAPDTVRRDWLLIVARDRANRVLSTTALAGGRSSVDCSGRAVDTFVLGAPLDERFAGGGIFSVEGQVLGLAAWCNGRVRAVPVSELRRLLAQRDSAGVPLDSAAASADSMTSRGDSTAAPRARR